MANSEVIFACKTEIQKRVDVLFPWVKEKADKILEHEEGTLYHFQDIEWMNNPDVKKLRHWLRDTQDVSDYTICEIWKACLFSQDEDMGCWYDNPWKIQKRVVLGYEEPDSLADWMIDSIVYKNNNKKMENNVLIDFDKAADVLYLRIEGAHIERSRESLTDDNLILNEDIEGKIVGVQVLFASNFKWEDHPERKFIPTVLCAALDLWQYQHEV